jgi:hypothetical protein
MAADEILWEGEFQRVNDALVSLFSKLILWISVCRVVSAG